MKSRIHSDGLTEEDLGVVRTGEGRIDIDQPDNTHDILVSQTEINVITQSLSIEQLRIEWLRSQADPRAALQLGPEPFLRGVSKQREDLEERRLPDPFGPIKIIGVRSGTATFAKQRYPWT